jgi:hypothetical protein
VTYTVKLNIPWKSCKSPWQIKNHGELPQQKQITNFIELHNITDVVHVTNTDDLCRHDMHVLTVNQSYCSLYQLADMVKCLANHSDRYLWVSINKFFIYSQQENNFFLDCPDWDLRLLNFVADQLPVWTIIEKIVRPDDRGQLGNFQHPVTALVAQKL